MGEEEFRISRTSRGPQLTIKAWNPQYRELMLQEGITHLLLSGYFGWRSSDIGFLQEIPFLERLDLLVPRIRDISPLYRLPALKELSVSGDVPPIDFPRIASLRSVGLSWSPKRYGSLVDCMQLDTLGVDNFRESDLSTFSKLHSLAILAVTYSSITRLNGLQHMPHLVRLSLAKVNQLTSLEGIQSCTHLSTVVVEGAQMLAEVGALGALRELETVGFADCPQLQSISALRDHPTLRSINLIWATAVRDGDLKFILSLPSLQHAAITDRKHYNIKDADLPKRYVISDAWLRKD